MPEPEAAVMEAPSKLGGSAIHENDELGDPLAKFGDAPPAPAKAPAKSEPKAEPKPDAKTAPKPDAKGKPPEKPEKGAAKPEEKEVPKPDDKTAAKPEEKPKEPKEEKQIPDVPSEKMAPKALREAYDGLKQKYKQLEKEHGEFRSKATSPKDDPEKLEIRKQLEEAQGQLKVLKDEFRYFDYERSEEFAQKYKQPYEDMAKRAVSTLADYRIDNGDGTMRPATAKDFWDVVRLPSQPEARQKAKSLFGDDAQDILDWRTKLRDSFHAMETAKAEFRQTGEQRQKEWERQQAEQQENFRKQSESDKALWDNLNKTALEQHKEWFVAADDDEEGRETLEKGFELADLAWNGSDKIDREKLIALRSAERNKAAGFRYQVLLNQRLASKVAELEKELEEFRNSTPGNGAPEAGQKAGDGLDDPFAKFE